jgi:hypothetical protein
MLIHVYDEMVETKMLVEIGVSVRRSREIRFSQQREEQSFRQGSQHGVVYRRGFRVSPIGVS